VAFLWPEDGSTVPALFWDIEHLEMMPYRGSSTVASVLMGCRASRDDAASGGSLGRGDMYGVSVFFGDVEHLVMMPYRGGSTVASVLVGCRASRDDAASK
jgi:hypothetical protein